ncbi:MAG: hypothetical protein LBT50_05760 [Prevotellaceae bacterium]|jgi:hypothetical protein|nr:hypothetical protein [Prevotellaceae bacterium]
MNETQTFWNFEGCSPFFISSAISSMWFGEKNRNMQFETTEERIAFQERMNLIRQEFEDAKFDKELFFRRESIELGRIYQQIEAKKVLKTNGKDWSFSIFYNTGLLIRIFKRFGIEIFSLKQNLN